MTITCDECYSAEDVTSIPLPGGGKAFTCTNAKKHKSGATHTWEPPAPPLAKKASTGGSSTPRVTDDLIEPFLAIISKLPRCWLEHGVIEYELRLQYPDLFGKHVEAKGHRMLGNGHHNASLVRFSRALQRIEALQSKKGEGTGAWAHDPTVSYWALKPVAPGTPDLTWEQYAKDHNRSPECTDEDKAELRRLSGR